MIDLKTISSFYPEPLRQFPRFILREYLQYKILEAVFQSEHASKLAFIGGTCLRIVHSNARFSEDIDFDNLGCTEEDRIAISGIIKRNLELQGYGVEMKVIHKNAWHCYIRFPEMLFREGLSGFPEEKILIQVDAEAQHYSFEPESWLMNKFDVFTEIFCAPLPLLMAHKCFAILNRKRNKGRDFFDLIYLLSRNLQPDYGFLSLKAGIESREILLKALLSHCAQLNMQEMANDVAPFLFNARDKEKIIHFETLLKQYWS
jgi:predicted nucleotidyltransferase component of viral defense system